MNLSIVLKFLFIKSPTVFTCMAGIKFVTSLCSTYLRMGPKIIMNLLS